ncbi:phosphatase PAP2 family protein [Rhodococcus sp. Z13]|uniref:Phosphatase PAP2 family protein n=1 Tax=Rhodococcus sacchari TaxID=2962047 RepID=A0ACD4DI74_9NOCA|nr:phosphatase PAP2 family protein [Rhodococcus sp. Z13]UYP19699.1 phosphatase PAP2 family protein [Rhodococcus sp. Z13]
MTVDTAVLEWAVSVREPWLTTAITVLTHTGGGVATTLFAAAATLLLVRADRPSDALIVAGAVLTGWPVMSLLKNLFGRARPPEPERLLVLHTESFPSGHAMTSAILATALAAVVVRTWPRGDRCRTVTLAGLAGYTVAIGLSRVYLAAHWLTDVVAGWIFGIVWALLWVWLITRVRIRL